MKLAILETGRPPGDLAERFGDYPAMFERLLGAGFEIETLRRAGRAAAAIRTAHDAYLITGSPAGVYDAAAVDRAAVSVHPRGEGQQDGRHLLRPSGHGRGARRPCREIGQGLGRGAAPLRSIVHWRAMDGWRCTTIAVPASHQDQVVVQPPNTEVIAAVRRSRPLPALAWTDRPAISFQFHPEFSPAFAKALIEKRYDIVPDPDAAIASLDAPNDNARVGGWIRRFLSIGAATGRSQHEDPRRRRLRGQEAARDRRGRPRRPQGGRGAGRDHGDRHLPHRRLHARRARQRRHLPVDPRP